MANFDFISEELRNLRESGLEWKKNILEGPSDPRTIVNGKKMLVMCSNNYLGLTTHPKLKRAAIAAIEKYGAGAGSVPVISGTMDLHVKLWKKIAEFKNSEAAIYFQTGFATNAGCIPQLVGEGDVVISDELNHGSIIDGVRLTKAERKIFKHKDMTDLEKVLKESQNARRILIITDGVFSMDGDIAPLDQIAKLAQQYGAMTYVDDAHGDGVLGRNGRGIVDHFNLHRKVDIEMGTFSKAFGTIGGYISASHDICDYMWNKSRTHLLSGSHPPATIAASIAALEVVDEEPQIVQRLWDNTRYYKKTLQSLGFDTGVAETPITPIMIGDNNKAQDFAKLCFEAGVMGVPIVFPMVAKGTARIRTIITA
ncbi:MAG: aminotransferase class I/II-fold pyridoxal phosphate-dependent enzyme, partial [Candidatus Aenigmarchaeota archaeon]|nr:aminotransferase class I/II-fold pyridoxal phosphate-dependent enzyme [Candidatus Aenigmarchaeota archaeon]